ncbi:MAG: two-component system response regulator [Deltaproteobacteria bacterium HGW-Deltaproteobacteria-19]|jgi:two-component system response regulator AtoC|nr:MAG: two-component system response regulator [Deltaproteobacteria bacterium HGW-Deltaproteobacteria-19]
MRRILVVDDDESVRKLLTVVLGKEGFDVTCADNGLTGLEAFRSTSADIVIMDIRMPEMDGLQALEEITKMRRGAAVILMTAYAAVETAVQAMKLGAFDYVIKPFDIDEILLLVERALQLQQMRSDINLLHRELLQSYRLDRILTDNPQMKDLCLTVPRIAGSNASVLITGESGSGKELFASAIHYNSKRCNGPFVKINCGAIPEGLLESEFFGHEKGAFTGAIARRRGRFEQANGGTIFLDEIADITPNLQVKLLRVLQEREFERIGSNETIKTDVRVIVATNRDLESMVRADTFRQDLYYRINVVSLHVPPLRERPEDIRLLADHFLQRFATENNREIVTFDDDAYQALMGYGWPGNVRELANAVESAVIMSTGSMIFSEDLPKQILGGERRMAEADAPDIQENQRPLKEMVKEFERLAILQALERNQENRVRTARELGISRRSLLYKLQEYDIS